MELVMPRLVKGAKFTYGWSKVSETGMIVIPPDAFAEYRLVDGQKVILMSGSITSGGFVLSTRALIEGSKMKDLADGLRRLGSFQVCEGEAVSCGTRIYCRVTIQNKRFQVPYATLALYGIKKGNLLLTVRGSRLGLNFVVRGPIVNEAKRHSELMIFQ